MKWYWLITNDNGVANPFVSDVGDLNGYEDWSFSVGRRIERWSGNAWVGASTQGLEGDVDDSLQNHFDLLIFSQRLRHALKEARIEGIQFLPIQVVHADKSRTDGFSVANILHCAPALDFDLSTYTRYPDDYFLPERRGQLEILRRVTLRARSLKDHDIVRLAEYRSKVFVSERFRQVVEGGGFTGLGFAAVALS